MTKWKPEECQHESDGTILTSYPPQYICIKCGQTYKDKFISGSLPRPELPERFIVDGHTIYSDLVILNMINQLIDCVAYLMDKEKTE